MNQTKEGPLIQAFVKRHKLPPAFAPLAEQYYLPLCEWVLPQIGAKPVVLGINGAQGTGKSTLAEFVADYFKAQEKTVVSLSIDDLYLTKSERADLAQRIHPLMQTRGVPGTHDVQAGIHYIQALKRGEPCKIMRFDKSIDDRCGESEWTRVHNAPDVIILEGWCVGAVPQVVSSLQRPINDLEIKEDASGIWRHYVNDALAEYQRLFAELDFLVMLKAPNFDCVYQWRLEQEQKLAAATGGGSGIMSAEQIARFIQHYERLTQHNLDTLPAVADVVFHLNNKHQIDKAEYKPAGIPKSLI